MVLAVIHRTSQAKPTENDELELSVREKRSSNGKLNHKVSSVITAILQDFEMFPKICHNQAVNVPYKSPLRKMMVSCKVK